MLRRDAPGNGRSAARQRRHGGFSQGAYINEKPNGATFPSASFGLFFINGRYPTKAASLSKAPLCKGSCQNDFKNHFD